ncbi:hypothetical protein Plhal304r1_c063g0151041 [Plasmopara halstedii]
MYLSKCSSQVSFDSQIGVSAAMENPYDYDDHHRFFLKASQPSCACAIAPTGAAQSLWPFKALIQSDFVFALIGLVSRISCLTVRVGHCDRGLCILHGRSIDS